MRRIANSRAGLPDPADFEGFVPTSLEGDPTEPGPDAIASLRPFGRDIPDQRLPAAVNDGSPDDREPARARALAGRGRRLDAIIVLREFLRERPRLVEPRLSLAELLAEGGDHDGAIDELSTALGVAADGAPVLVRRGALYARMGQPKDAERDFREAIKRDPKHWPAYRYLGVTRLRLGRPEDAEAALREAITLAPQDPETVLYLGETLLSQGRLEAAFDELRRAVELAPSDPRGFTLLGRLFDRLGRTDEAMAMHRKATEVTTA
jgi:Flp pilus assembly protein TadD